MILSVQGCHAKIAGYVSTNVKRPGSGLAQRLWFVSDEERHIEQWLIDRGTHRFRAMFVIESSGAFDVFYQGHELVTRSD